MESIKVLVVEDEKMVLTVIINVLKMGGIPAAGFANPSEALTYFTVNSGNVEMVITDFGLPRMNGVEFAKKIKEIKDSTLMILTSGYNCDGLGFDDEIRSLFHATFNKPIAAMELMQKVKSLLSDKNSA